jgi:hypothetical protein
MMAVSLGWSAIKGDCAYANCQSTATLSYSHFHFRAASRTAISFMIRMSMLAG